MSEENGVTRQPKNLGEVFDHVKAETTGEKRTLVNHACINCGVESDMFFKLKEKIRDLLKREIDTTFSTFEKEVLAGKLDLKKLEFVTSIKVSTLNTIGEGLI
jgi:hypothetical protein